MGFVHIIILMTHHFYIHIPFCRQKCPYCKFALTPIFDEFKKRRYIEYLKKEIREYFSLSSWETKNLPEEADFSYRQNDSEVYPVDKKVQTIYFWGWTPSILSIEEIREILECFLFYKNTPCEITLEANPEDITEDYVRSIVELGINRISIGVQTLNERSLTEIHRSNRQSITIAFLNIWSALLSYDRTLFSSICEFFLSVDTIFERIWNCLSVASFSNSKNKSNTENKMKHRRFRKLLLLLVAKVRKLTQKYIINKRTISINTDFILGLPYVQSWETLAGIKKLHTDFPFITHTSVYMLEDDIYPNDWKANSISENELRNEFLEIIEYFTYIWWNHYELSNWAKPGYESIHNRAYWNHSNYRGFGLSAASYEDNIRWNNSESFGTYYTWEIQNKEALSNEQVEIENMMFGLRTWGWDISTQTITSIQKIQQLIDNGLIEMNNNTIKPTKTWIFVIDYIMSELIDI